MPLSIYPFLFPLFLDQHSQTAHTYPIYPLSLSFSLTQHTQTAHPAYSNCSPLPLLTPLPPVLPGSNVFSRDVEKITKVNRQPPTKLYVPISYSEAHLEHFWSTFEAYLEHYWSIFGAYYGAPTKLYMPISYLEAHREHFWSTFEAYLEHFRSIL
jgi:hypothetical protein